MTYLEIFQKILIDGLLIGAGLAVFGKWLEERLKLFESGLEQERKYNQSRFQTLVDAYNNVWGTLIEIEYSIQYELVPSMENGDFSKNPFELKELILSLVKKMRKAMIFLPNQLYESTNSNIENLINSYNELMQPIERIIKLGGVDRLSDRQKKEILQDINQKLEVLYTWQHQLAHLCEQYRQSSQDLMFEDVLKPYVMLGREHSSRKTFQKSR